MCNHNVEYWINWIFPLIRVKKRSFFFNTQKYVGYTENTQKMEMELYYLTTHSTHFIYDYTTSDC